MTDKVYSVAKNGAATEFSYGIFSSVQKRGNCTESSSNILIKLLLKEGGWDFAQTVYGQEIVAHGKGYDDFKKIKKDEMKLVMNFLTKQNLSEVGFEAKMIMMGALQQMFLQAVKKGNFKLLSDVGLALLTSDEDFYFDKIKDLSGRNAMFFVAMLDETLEEAFEYCYDEYGISLIDRDVVGMTPAVLAIENGNVAFVELLIERFLTGNEHFFEDEAEQFKEGEESEEERESEEESEEESEKESEEESESEVEREGEEDEEKDKGDFDEALREVGYLLNILSQTVRGKSVIQHCKERKEEHEGDESKSIEDAIEKCKNILEKFNYLSSDSPPTKVARFDNSAGSLTGAEPRSI